MKTNDKNKALPGPVLRRLPRYLLHARELGREGVQWVSSLDLAHSLGYTSSLVRHDLSYVDLVGVSKRGYRVNQMSHALSVKLCGGEAHGVIVIGAGQLGRAIAANGALEDLNFHVRALCDSDPNVVGSRAGCLTVAPMKDMPGVIEAEHIDIGVLAVPADAAQQLADELIEAGIKGILNLAHVHLHVPDHVYCHDVRLGAHLQVIAYMIDNSPNGDHGKSGNGADGNT